MRIKSIKLNAETKVKLVSAISAVCFLGDTGAPIIVNESVEKRSTVNVELISLIVMDSHSL